MQTSSAAMLFVLYITYGFALFFLIYDCIIWLLHFIALTYGNYRLHKKRSIDPVSCEQPYPGVSIIKPLVGVDSNLATNLETFFTMTYPLFELLFCLEDQDDPSLQVVNTLIAKYPKVDTRVFIGTSTVSVNPKINNMHGAYEASKYEFILISDSRIRMKADTLQDMVDHMNNKTGLVHQMPFTCDQSGFAAILEKIFFGTAHSRIYLASDFLRINCHTGMSTLMRKQVLEENGGLKAFGCYLAEDYFIAKLFGDKRWRTRICSQPALQNSGDCSVHSFQARLIRWAKLRVAMLPLIVLLEPLSECIVLGAFAAWSVNIMFQWNAFVFYLIHILIWFISDWTLLSIVQNGSLPFSKYQFVVGWLFRECTAPYLFLNAVLNPTIEWRNRRFKLSWGGTAAKVVKDDTVLLEPYRASPNSKYTFTN